MPSESAWLEAFIGEFHPNRQYDRSQRKLMKRQGPIKVGRSSGKNKEF
jgi:hypothetical protein